MKKVIYERIAPLMLVRGFHASCIVYLAEVAVLLTVFRLAAFSVNFEKLKIVPVRMIVFRVVFL